MIMKTKVNEQLLNLNLTKGVTYQTKKKLSPKLLENKCY